MSSIVFDATLNVDKLEAGIQRANKTVGNWAADVEKQASSIDNAMARVGGSLAAYFSVRALSAFGKEVIAVRGEFQQLSIAFETMLGSKEKADKLMQEAISFSEKTPFTLTDVASNIKQLMAMGIATEDVMSTMKMLGDVAAGVSVPIGRVAISYGQIATLGTLQGREVRELAMAGIPIIAELAKNLGKTKDEIGAMVTAGQVKFPMVSAAFKSMASEGGKFYNMMEKQNASVTGQISNLRDKWDLMLNDIGKSNEGIIYGGISGLQTLVGNYKTVLSVIEGLVLILGAAKVATIFVAREQAIQAGVMILTAGATDAATVADARWVVMQERAAIAQKSLNASMLANPYVLAAAAITALLYAGYKFLTYQTELEKATQKAQIEIENEKDKVLDLFSALKATKDGTEEWVLARKKIIDQYGQYIPAQLQEFNNLGQIKEAQDLVNKSLSENIAIRVRGAELEKINTEYNTDIVKAQGNITKAVESKLGKERASEVKFEIAQLIANYKAGLPDAEKALTDYRQKLMAEVGTINKEGLATSFSAANMANDFRPLFDALKGIKSETDLTNAAFDKFGKTLEKKPDANVTMLKDLETQKNNLQSQIADATGKLFSLEQTPKVSDKDISNQKAKVTELENQLLKFKQSLQVQLAEAKGKLETILVTPDKFPDTSVKQQEDLISGLDKQLNQLKTAVEERTKLRKQLVIEEKKLEVIQITPSADPLKAVADQEIIIKGIKDQLKAKDAEVNKEAEKRKKDQLDYDTATGRALITNQLDIEQQKLDLQKDSAQKQRDQADIDFQKKLVEIKSQQADELRAFNETPQVGGINKDTSAIIPGKYVAELPKVRQDQIDEQITLATQKREDTIKNINEKAAEDLKKIYDEVVDYRLKGIDKEKAEVKKKYDDMEREVKRLNGPETSTLLSDITAQRGKANSEIDTKYALEMLDAAENMALARNAIVVDGYNRDEKLRKLDFETFKQYEEQKIKILRQEGTPESNTKADEAQIKLDEAAGKNQEESLKKQLELRNKLVQAAAELTNQIGQQLGLDEKSMGFLNKGIDAAAQLAEGNVIGSATSLLSAILTVIPTETERFKKQIDAINVSLEQQARLIEQSKQSGGQEAARKDELNFLNQKAAAEKAEYEKLQKSADKHLDLLGWRQDKADAAYATWQATTVQIEDANAALTEFYTDTTALAVADAISQGFQEGKTSAADFADVFNEFLVSAINSALEEMSKPEISA